MGGLLLISLAWAADCKLEESLAEAEEQLLYLDFEAAQKALDQAEEQFACRPATRQEQAKYWLVWGALGAFSGDDEQANQGLTAARVLDEGYWLDALGEDMQVRWETSTPPVGKGSLVVSPVPDQYEVHVDGKLASATEQVASGLHIVQVTRPDDEAEQPMPGFAKVIDVHAGDTVNLPTGLATSKKGSVQQGNGMSVFVGANVGFLGQVADSIEPGRPMTAIEAGLHLGGSKTWARASLSAMFGSFTFVSGTETSKLPVSPSLLLAGGASFGNVHVGGLTGLQLPGRIPLQAVAGLQLHKRWTLEGRGGVNALGLTTTTEPEPAKSRRWEPVASLGVLFR